MSTDPLNNPTLDPKQYPVINIPFIIDGGGSVITAGIKGDLDIQFPCIIKSVTLLADQTGSIVIDIWKDSFANYSPTVADTITSGAKPTISANIKSYDDVITGWTKLIEKRSVLRINVDSVSAITRVTLSLAVIKI